MTTIERFQAWETREFPTITLFKKIRKRGGGLDGALIIPKLNIHLFTGNEEGPLCL